MRPVALVAAFAVYLYLLVVLGSLGSPSRTRTLPALGEPVADTDPPIRGAVSINAAGAAAYPGLFLEPGDAGVIDGVQDGADGQPVYAVSVRGSLSMPFLRAEFDYPVPAAGES